MEIYNIRYKTNSNSQRKQQTEGGGGKQQVKIFPRSSKTLVASPQLTNQKQPRVWMAGNCLWNRWVETWLATRGTLGSQREVPKMIM